MTQTRSGKIADTTPQASRRHLTAKIAETAQRPIDKPKPSTEQTEGSNSTITADLADGASTCTENATEDHAANNSVPSASKNPGPSDPALPTDSATSGIVTRHSVAAQDAPPMLSTQPVNTAAKDFAPAVADAALTESTAEDHAANIPVPSTSEDAASTESTTRAVSTCGTTNGTAGQDALPAGPQGNASCPSDKAQTLVRIAGNSQPVAELQAGTTKRKSERHARKRNVTPLITMLNSPDDPIIVDDGSDDSGSDESVSDGSNESVDDGTDNDQSDDAPISRSIKQVLRYRQRHLEKMKSSLDDLIAYIGSTADSDQSGDYSGMRVGKKRSFEDFVAAELDDSDQPKIFANDLLNQIRESQGMLRRTKRFHRQ